MKNRTCLAGFASIALIALAATATQAQTRTIRTIVPFGPGGVPDVVARAIGDYIGRTHKVTTVVENRPGAGSIIATDAVKRMAGDPDALLMTASSFLINPHLRKVNYNPLTDFTPICHLVSQEALIAVSGESPYKTLDDLIKAARAEPGKLSAGAPGPGSSHHLVFEGLKQRAKIDMTYIPYPGTGQAVSGTLGGHVTAVLSAYSSLAPQLKSGQLRALAIASLSGERMAALPDVPTLQEAGFSGLGLESWFGVVAPAKLPKAAADELIAWHKEALADKTIAAKLTALQLNPKPICGNDYAKFLQDTGNTFGEIIRGAKLNVQ